MAEGEISEALCGDEQGADECVGCAARTRRCLGCGACDGIADPQRGFCARCAGSDQDRVPAERRATPKLTDAHQRIDELLAGFDAPCVAQLAQATYVDSTTCPDTLASANQSEHLRLILDEILAPLDARAAQILRLRLGIGEKTPLTLEETALREGMKSRQHVLQIQQAGLQQLQPRIPSDVYDAIVAHLDVPRRLSYVNGERISQRKREPQLQLVVSDRAKDTGGLLDLLLEHAQPRADGTFVVKAPLRILNVRGKLIIDEACGALASLAQANRICGKAPWTEIVLAQSYAERIFQKRQEVEARTSVETVMPDQRRRAAVGVFAAPAERVSRRDLWQASRPSPPRIAPVPSPSVGRRQMPAHAIESRLAAAVAELTQSSIITNGERVVRGALPLLQIKLRIGPALARSILERLCEAGHVTQKDGWRSIVLLKGEVPEPLPSPSPQPPAALQAPHLRVISPTDSAETVDRMLAELSELPTADDRTIEQLEEALARANEQRAELTRLMEKIAARIETLRAAKEARVTARELEAKLAHVLCESRKIVDQLFALLRGDETP